MFKSEQLQAVHHMYDGRDSYAITTWRARFIMEGVTEYLRYYINRPVCQTLARACRLFVAEYFVHAQTVCTRPLSVSRPGNEASQVIHAINHISLGYAGGGGGGGNRNEYT